MSLKKRMIVIGLVSLVGMLVIGGWSVWQQRNETYKERMVMLKSLVESARTQAMHFQELEKQGKLSTAEAKNGAREALRPIRFQGDNYFFIYDTEGLTILLPPTPDKEGQSRIDLKDSNGVPLIRNLIEAGRGGGGFSTYNYPRAGQKEALPKLAYSESLGTWNWVVGSGLYVDDIDAAFRSNLILTIVVVLLLAAVVFGVVWLISHSVLSEIGGEPSHAMVMMRKVAAGDLTVALEPSSSGSLLAELDTLIRSLRSLISEIYSGAENIQSASQHIRQSSSMVAETATSQAHSTQNMAAAMEELTVSISHISENATDTEHFAVETVKAASEGEKQIGTAVSSMGVLSSAIGEAVTRIDGLSQRVQEVGSIASTIKEIADQTNLLALNAAIEAARAGESGRGFAVVADEVRKLAERTTLATGEIERTITSIQGETGGAVGAMNSAATQAEQSVGEVSQSASLLGTIAEGAAHARDLVAEVANAAREQRSASTLLAQQVEHVAQSAEETSNSMKETAGSAESLEHVATGLHDAVARFRC